VAALELVMGICILSPDLFESPSGEPGAQGTENPVLLELDVNAERVTCPRSRLHGNWSAKDLKA
jgi:hypothetical protein